MVTIELSAEVSLGDITGLTSSILRRGVQWVDQDGQTKQLWPNKISVHTFSGSTAIGNPGRVHTKLVGFCDEHGYCPCGRPVDPTHNSPVEP